MLDPHQNISTLTKLGPWLCCFSSDILIDYYLCHHCSNHLIENVISFYSEGIIIRSHIGKSALQNAMQRLPSEQRRVITLKIIKGFSNREVADILSKSIGTVKTTQNRALISLIHLLYSKDELMIAPHKRTVTQPNSPHL